MLKPALIAKTDAKSDEKQMFVAKGYRITALTSRLIRIESDKDNNFTDLPSQTIWFRRFQPIKFDVKEQKGKIIVTTSDIKLSITKSSMTPENVVFLQSGVKAECINFGNLKGTRRTLDATFGKVPLEDGLISVDGVHVLDDSQTFLINSEGEFCHRDCKGKDLYVFAYEKNYRETIKAFYSISSPTPIIPRFALGVWWSRYRQYTQEEYQDLMLRFKKENVPLTVATVDMDWHWTDVNAHFGTNYKERIGCDNPVTGGWTGYSWNTDLFPDYKGFLKFLKNENLNVTLNLHPADGVRFFETQYKDMAKAMGVDPKTKEDINFRCGSDKFWNAYFDVLHKPYEKEGVDFWWIDWQQGKKSDVNGLDPLIPLNHYHYLDNAEDGRIPLILSRYSGFGSHRYPLGFSGDTAISWAVLDFQPYFTITAANSAYTWWSHDIGGHHQGRRDEELYMRWLQFGVFSPIMRLHSTSDDLLGKEPWKYRKDVAECAKNYLRLRHHLIPYIYTMDYRTHNDGIALCEPMYYSYPENSNAYDVKNQYMFGSELMVCPITTKQHSLTNLGSVNAFIPKGRWTDVFTGDVYQGEQILELHRELYDIPVLAKEGAIIPLCISDGNSTENPTDLTLWVFSGNNKFTLYEDNSKTDYNEHNAKTTFEIKYDEETEKLDFIISAPTGDISVLPKSRTYRIVLKDVDCDNIKTEKLKTYVDEKSNCVIILEDIMTNLGATISISNAKRKTAPSKKEQVISILSRWQADNNKKKIVYRPFKKAQTKEELEAAVKKSILPQDVVSAIEEKLQTL